MKYVKRNLALALTVIMIVSVMAVPASAATISTINWDTQFSSFPQLYNGSTQNGYIKMLQRFLLLYPFTYSSIYNASSAYGGVDGGFGNKTEAAVKIFQRNALGAGEDDGYVGTKTWGAIRDMLTGSSILRYDCSDGSPASGLTTAVIRCVQSGSVVYLGTYNHENEAFASYFRTIS